MSLFGRPRPGSYYRSLLCGDFSWPWPMHELDKALQLPDEEAAPREETTMQTPYEIRLECLRLAMSDAHHTEIVERAEAFLEFVKGTSAKSPREQINSALDAANVK